MQILRPVAIAAAAAGLVLALAAGTAAAATPTAAGATGAEEAVCRCTDTVASTAWTGRRAKVADRDLAFSGRIAYTAPMAGTSAWLSVGGGGHGLDLIQVGVHDCGFGPRFFAAWGSGSPALAGSTYEEVDLGEADLRPHAFGIALSQGTWRLSIDGRVARTVSDDFRTWAIAWIQSMTESHTDAMPSVVVSSLTRTQAGARGAAAFGYALVGAPALAARFEAGARGFSVSAR